MENRAVYEFVKNGIDKTKILVVGDVMLDKYYYGEVNRISPEAPVPITRVLSEKETLGGAANVAANLARLGAKVSMAGILGKDGHGESLKSKCRELNINIEGMFEKNTPTNTKIRVIGGSQQMIRLDFEDTAPPDKQITENIKRYIADELLNVDTVIISDYGKGLITEEIARYTITEAKNNGVFTVVDPKGIEWKKYMGADFITPNFKEIEAVMPESIENEDSDVIRAASYVMREFHIQNVIVTRSAKGMTLVERETITNIPAKKREVFDVSGAGDTVIAVFSAAIAGSLKPADAANLANTAAGVVVLKLGTYAICKEELLRELE